MKLEDVILKLKEDINDRALDVYLYQIFSNNVDGNIFWGIGKDYIKDLIKLLIDTNNAHLIELNKIIELLNNESEIVSILKNANTSFEKLEEIFTLNEIVRKRIYEYIIWKLSYYIEKTNKIEMMNMPKDVKTNLDDLCDEDEIFANIFGKEKQVEVFSTGDNRFDEKGDYKKRYFKLSKEEIEILKWFLENVNIEDYKKQILEYCNDEYSMWSDIKITEQDIEEEINIYAIAINVTKNWKANNGVVYPEISFYGSCKCDEEHGICIGFRDGKFLGIGSQDWTLCYCILNT